MRSGSSSCARWIPSAPLGASSTYTVPFASMMEQPLWDGAALASQGNRRQRSAWLVVASMSPEKEHPNGRNQCPLATTEPNLSADGLAREQVRSWPGSQIPSVKLEPGVGGKEKQAG